MNFSDQIWRTFLLFSSASTTQKYLQKCYQHLSIEESKKYSFQNCNTFIYYLQYAHTFYTQANNSPLTLRPILQFYGYTNLLKACLLTIDPFYPSTTTLLAHGVTTRKKKKQHYRFMKDEIKIQKNGLFTYFGEKVFHVKHLDGEKLTMESLLSQIPELIDERNYFNLNNSFKLTKIDDLTYACTNQILDSFHFTPERFSLYLKKACSLSINIQEKKHHLIFQLEMPFTYNYHYPFMYNIQDHHFYFPRNKDNYYPQLREMMIHYLLLYNLSMVARYETEWWLDLTKNTPNEDYPLIQAFLNTTQSKCPFLISKWLLEERNYSIS
ncbi:MULTISPECIES: YaaC family protein [Bacillus]|uniref:YaaC family protein n=1 Tax=Bacillus TaxID=1386 RepID=UPI0002EA5140|nr:MULTISPECIES: YaaC family protein [Bacillus]